MGQKGEGKKKILRKKKKKGEERFEDVFYSRSISSARDGLAQPEGGGRRKGEQKREKREARL